MSFDIYVFWVSKENFRLLELEYRVTYLENMREGEQASEEKKLSFASPQVFKVMRLEQISEWLMLS